MTDFTSSRDLIQRLRSVLVRQRTVLFFAGLSTTVAVVLFTWVALTLVAGVTVLPVWLKIVLLSLSGMTALFFFVRFALARLLDGNVDSVALALEDSNPHLKGRLIAAVQFAQRQHRTGYSSELIEATERQALSEAGQIDFGEVITFSPVLRTVKMFAGATVLAAALAWFAPGLFSNAFEVYSHPTTRIAPAVAYQVVPVPGSTDWIKYRDIEVGGAVIGHRLPDKAYVHHRLAGGNWQKTRIELTEINPIGVAAGDSLDFGITLRQISRSFDYYVEAGEIESEIQQVNVVDRPRVTGINLSIFYPDYTGLSPMTIDENNGSFSAVVGSRVNMKLATNLPVRSAELVFEDDSRTPMTVTGKTAEVALVVDRSKGYRVELRDGMGEENPDPIQYYITAVPDEYPSVDVVRPGYDVNLNDEMVLPLLVRIFDDYGFSSLVMKFMVFTQGRPSEEHVAVLHFSDDIKTEGDVEFNWDMDRLNLFPGDYVAYYFEIADNDQISGPKISRSRQYIARLPSLDEIIAQSETENTQRIVSAEEMLRAGKELTERLRQAARTLEAQNKSNRTGDWQQQKELEAIAQKSEEMTQQIDQMADDMQQSLDRMKNDALMSREIVEKLSQIQKLFQEIATPEMREAQRKMMEALEQMDRDMLKQAMEQFEMSQEDLMQRLERTLALLKKMQVMQKMEAMIRKAEQLAERQENLNEQTDSADKESLPEMSQAEDDIKKSLEQLKQEAKELRRMMAEAEMNEVPEAEEFAKAVENTDADQDMQQMSEALKQKKQKQAGSDGQKAHTKVMEMLDQMQQMQMALQGDDSEEMRKAMRRSLDHANNLSKDQEDLLREANEIDPRSGVMRDMAASQQDIMKACSGLKQSLAALQMQSPFIASELLGLVNSAVTQMEMATESFDNKRGSRALESQRQAMVDLNRAATRLMESMEQQSQCDKGGNCDKGMANLESLGKKQNQLNQQTRGMCNNPPQQGQGQPMSGGAEQRAGFERLAAEQGAIRKSLQEMEQEFGGSRQVLGRLSDIANEMKEIEESLREGDVGPETTERQLKVYSRMLEAARSLQRKDYSERRRANSATETAVFVPPSLPRELFDEDVRLEDRLRRFLGDSYPPQYEEQIKAYFKALLKAESELRNPAAGGATP
ncbi:MAG: hypothetical protein GY867_12350 [bacterium]|nr:hypothetical protein [bacterium]